MVEQLSLFALPDDLMAAGMCLAPNGYHINAEGAKGGYTVKSSGLRANQNGQTAEVIIDAVLRQKHLTAVRQYVIGSGIFDTPIKVDFYLPAVPSYPHGVVLKSKWQEVGGSADEKLPYLVANIQQCFPCPAIVVIDGIGFRPGAIAWLRRQVGGNLIAVQNLQEFVTWCNRF